MTRAELRQRAEELEWRQRVQAQKMTQVLQLQADFVTVLQEWEKEAIALAEEAAALGTAVKQPDGVLRRLLARCGWKTASQAEPAE